ncbi:hypothetical protein FRX31_034674 [Thalictrum thalictroides]|uniref:Uncharacterized protein n=1 Tax=Thalictrum thalictroides TaxID=46969 RepID=A0A7J6UT57_THATH|nr:hypothetical protein FRX31_034674 [Thalictrum thalictroides]
MLEYCVRSHNTTESHLAAWPKLGSNGFREGICATIPYATIWVIWCIHNAMIFNSEVFSVEKAVARIKWTVWVWMELSRAMGA